MIPIVVEDEADFARTAADVVEAALRAEPALALALPTGATPLGLYAELVRRCRAGALSFAGATIFDLDEYVGLGRAHPLSCAAYLDQHLLRGIDAAPGRVRLLDGAAADPALECARHEAAIARAGGLGLAIVGIGRNGHLAMNEPGTPLDARTGVRTLVPATLADNARLYPAGSALPDRGLSMGTATLREARAVLLLARGEAKAEAIARALAGPVTPDCPASVLQDHPRLHVVVDRAAAARSSR